MHKQQYDVPEASTAQQEENSLNMMDIVVMLTPDQAASDILQAVINDQRDLTLAPNPDIAFILQIYKDDPEKAEKFLGEAYIRRVHASSEQGAFKSPQQ